MKVRFILVLLWALVLHVIISFAFILDPPFLNVKRLSTLYKKYVLPGPFFKDSQVIDTYSMTVSWKLKGIWTLPVNPAKKNFDQYHASLDLTELYRSRMIRSLYVPVSLPDSSLSYIRNRKEFHHLKKFLTEQYIPDEADSVRIKIIHNQAENFTVKRDSLTITILK